MPDLDHLHPTFRDRVLATGVAVNSGARSHARQQELWEDFQAGRGNSANRPGTSWHEYDEAVSWPPTDPEASGLAGGPWALAVDFAEPYPHGADGLIFPIPGEPWHAQPAEVPERQRTAGAWARLPLPEPADPLKIGDRNVLVLDSSLTLVTIVTFADKAIDVEGGHPDDGTKIQQWERNGSKAQQWYVDPCGTPEHPHEVRLISAASGRVLDIAGGGGPGTQLIQYPWNGTDNQRWQLIPRGDGPVAIHSSRRLHEGQALVVDVGGRSPDNGTPIVIWTPNGGANQFFGLVPV